MSPSPVTCLVLMCGLLCLHGTSAQFGMPKKKEEKKAPAIKADIPLIRCGVCEAIVKASTKMVKTLIENTTATRKLSEGDIIENLEKFCSPEQEAGDWIANQDIVEDGDKLKIVDMGQMGHCDTECRTIARACEYILEDVDLSDYSELLYGGKKRAALTQWLCYESSDACRKKAPAVPKDRKPGPAFKAMSVDEVRNKKLLRTMKESGMSGTMYDRESLQEEMDEMKEQMGDEFPPGMEDEMKAELGDKEAPIDSGAEANSGSIADGISKAASSMKNAAGKVMDGAGKLASKIFHKVAGDKDVKPEGEL